MRGSLALCVYFWSRVAFWVRRYRSDILCATFQKSPVRLDILRNCSPKSYISSVTILLRQERYFSGTFLVRRPKNDDSPDTRTTRAPVRRVPFQISWLGSWSFQHVQQRAASSHEMASAVFFRWQWTPWCDRRRTRQQQYWAPFFYAWALVPSWWRKNVRQ